MVQVNVKWQRQVFEAVSVDTSEAPNLFKWQLYSLTGVPPERQTVLGFKGGKLRDSDDASAWDALGARDGMTVMLLGSSDAAGAAASNGAAAAGAAPERSVRNDMDGDAPPSGSAATTTGDGAGGEAAIRPGLENLGNTCYMNATLQCLAQVPELVEQARARVDGRGDGEQQQQQQQQQGAGLLTRAYGSLLRDMELHRVARGAARAREGPSPAPFLSALRVTYPQFAQTGEHGLYMQQDAEECYSQILASLSQSLKASSLAAGNTVDELFGLELQTVDQCRESDDEEAVTRTQHVRFLPCHISRNVNHLNEGVREGLEETIERHSEKLGRAAQWKRVARINRLPPYLNLHFVRFFWKAVEKVKAKILRKVTFPMTLDVYEYCTEELREELRARREALRQREEQELERRQRRQQQQEAANAASPPASASANGANDNNDGDAEQKSAAAVPTGFYELYAVLTHQGRAADSGHYVGWVRDTSAGAAPDAWLKYDDDRVVSVTADDVLRLCGGGDWHMAYICLYRAKTVVPM